MPGSLVKRNELQQCSAALDHEVRGYAQSLEVGKRFLHPNVKLTLKQRLGIAGAILAFRQRNTVHYKEFNASKGWAFIKMGAWQPLCRF